VSGAENASLEIRVESDDQQHSLHSYLTKRGSEVAVPTSKGVDLPNFDPSDNATVIALVEEWRGAYPTAEVTLRQGTSETVLRTET
jgi:hypothetical protein